MQSLHTRLLPSFCHSPSYVTRNLIRGYRSCQRLKDRLLNQNKMRINRNKSRSFSYNNMKFPKNKMNKSRDFNNRRYNRNQKRRKRRQNANLYIFSINPRHLHHAIFTFFIRTNKKSLRSMVLISTPRSLNMPLKNGKN